MIGKLKCPYCSNVRDPGPIELMGIVEDLERFGKTIIHCPSCRKLYLIREDREGKPFIEAAKYKN